MQFAPDTVDVLRFDVALANTHPRATRSGVDELTSVAAVDGLFRDYRFSGRHDRDEEELAGIRAVRDLLRRCWGLPADDLVAAVNEMLTRATFRPHLERHDGLDWHLHTSPDDAPLADRMRVEAAFAMIDLIRSGETDRLRVCEADDCEGLLADLSRNRSKRFCSVRCGNRMNMIAFRDRQAEDDT